MTANAKPQSKLIPILLWGALFLCVIVWPILLVLRSANRPAPVEAPGLGHSIVMLVLAIMAIGAGIVGYLGAVFTQCLTFDFTRPVWHEIKAKQFLANLLFPTMVMLGVGFFSSAMLTPVAARFNLPGEMAFMAPFFLGFVLMQVLSLFVLVWSPMEKRIIKKRLAALGITPDQMRGGIYVGLSNPAVTSSKKRFFSIEEDVGMLWFTPQQMIYWGDVEQFAISQHDLVQVERKVDAKSTTALSGTAHVVLHIRLSDNSERQIRLHTEAIWTLLGKRRASNDLAARINAWLAGAPAQVS